MMGGALPPTARAALTRPYRVVVPVPMIESVVWVRRSTTACALVPYPVDQIKAASPDTKGVAIEVPLFDPYEPSFVVDRIDDPGAESVTVGP